MSGSIKSIGTLVSVLLLFLSGSAHAAVHEIRNMPGGGDCTSPNVSGIWSWSTLTCTLTRDLTGTLWVKDNGITINGLQHHIEPGPGDRFGIYAKGVNSVIVSQLNISGYDLGILFVDSQVISIMNNTVQNTKNGGNSCGICFSGTHLSKIEGNKVKDNKAPGVKFWSSTQNIIQNNEIERNSSVNISLLNSSSNRILDNIVLGDGQTPSYGVAISSGFSNSIVYNKFNGSRDYHVDISDSDNNTIFFNTMIDSVNGVHVIRSKFNKVYCNDITSAKGVNLDRGTTGSVVWWNNFFDLTSAADRNRPGLNQFDLPRPVGGNYWAKHEPNCVDQPPQLDGFCDVPFQFPGNQDLHPHVRKIPWRFNPMMCLVTSSRPPIDELTSSRPDLSDQDSMQP